jgi:prophage regulatory protein
MKGAKMTQKVLRRPAVVAKTGESTSTIYEKMARGEFPRPIRLGKRSVGWIEDELDAYIAKRIAERDHSQRVA